MLNFAVKFLSQLAFVFACLAYAGPSHAQNPQALSVGGELFAPDGSRISSNAVNFKIELRDASGTCTLYTESHLAQDLNASNGRFNLILGQGTSPTNNVEGSAQFTPSLFVNDVTSPVTGCTGAVTRAAGDARQIRISYDLGSGYTALTPNVPVVASAYAMLAESLQGKAAADFIQVTGTASGALNQANAEFAFSTTNWPRLQALLNGTSTQYLGSSPSVPVDLNGQRLVNVADPTAAQNAATKNYVDTTVAGKPVDVTAVGPMTGNGSVLRWDATANKWVAGTINTSATGTAGGDLQGSYPNPTIKNDAITAAKIASGGGGINRLLITNGSDGTTVGYGACAINQVYAWTASGWLCTNVSALSPVTSVAGKTGVVTLNAADVSGLGTAALKDVGTAAGQVPLLDGSGRLPAVDGSQLSNVNASRLQGRTVAGTAPTPSQVLGWNALLTQWEPTTVAAGNSGTVTSVAGGGGLTGGPITSTGTLNVDVGSAAGKIVQENASAQILQTPGVTTLPTYSFAGSPGTGVYSPATNALALTANGTTRLTVTPSGRIGIGSAAPTVDLDVVGTMNVSNGATILGSMYTGQVLTTGGSALLPAYTFTYSQDTGAFEADGFGSHKLAFTAAGVERMRVTATGIGIGVTTPQAALDVNATGSTPSALIVPRDSTTNRPSAAVNGMLRYNNTANAFEAYANGAWSFLATGTSPGGSSPWTTTGSDIYYNLGKVGIGTATPGTALDVVGDIRASAAILGKNGAAAAPSFTFTNGGDTGMFLGGTQVLGFATSGTERMRIAQGGNVGIGTINPASTLHLVRGYGGAPTAAVGRALIIQDDAGAGDTLNVDLIGGPTGNASLNFGSRSAVANGNIAYNNTSSAMTFGTNGAQRMSISATGAVSIGPGTTGAGLDVATTGTIASALIVPRDSTLNRPSTPVNGMIRYNNTANAFEGYTNGTWSYIATGTSTSGTTAPTFPLLASPIGTAAAPAYSFSGNANTGLYSPATNQVAIATSGVAALTIAANGDATFASTTGSGNANSGAVRIAGGLGVAGQISAGTTVIAPRLVAYAGTGGPYTPTASLAFPYATNIQINNPVSIDGAVSALNLLTTNAAANGQSAYIGAVANTAGYAPTIVFGQQTASSTYTERMRIDASGKVGVGSAAPNVMLDVLSPAATADAARFMVSGQADGGISVGGSGSTAGAQGMYANAGDLYLTTGSTERFRIRSGGQAYISGTLGVGTSAPGTTLDVNGGLRAGAATVVTATCGASVEGVQRYNYTTHTMEFCNGTSWLAVTYQNAGTVVPVVASGPPVSANTYAFTAATANYSPTFGSIANVWDGVFATAGVTANSNGACVRLDGGSSGNQIVLDLGSSKLINKVYFDSSGGNSDYVLGLSFSTDNVTFTSSVAVGPDGTGGYVTYKAFTLGSSVTARYIRVVNGGSNSGSYATFCDVAVGP